MEKSTPTFRLLYWTWCVRVQRAEHEAQAGLGGKVDDLVPTRGREARVLGPSNRLHMPQRHSVYSVYNVKAYSNPPQNRALFTKGEQLSVCQIV